jgi:hypothetical protein
MSTTDLLLKPVKPTPDEASVVDQLIRVVVQHDLGLRHLYETDPEFRLAARQLAGVLPIVMAALRETNAPNDAAEAVVFRTAYTVLERAREAHLRASMLAAALAEAPEPLPDPIAEPPC